MTGEKQNSSGPSSVKGERTYVPSDTTPHTRWRDVHLGSSPSSVQNGRLDHTRPCPFLSLSLRSISFNQSMSSKSGDMHSLQPMRVSRALPFNVTPQWQAHSRLSASEITAKGRG